MKTQSYLCFKTTFMVSFCMIVLSACSSEELVDETSNNVIDLGAVVSETVFNQEIVGKCWEMDEVHEVLPDGTISEDNYIESVYGFSFPSIYFENGNSLTLFGYASSGSCPMKHEYEYRYDAEVGKVIYSNYQHDGLELQLVDYRDGRLCVKDSVFSLTDGQRVYTSLISVYTAVSEEELANKQKRFMHDNDIAAVNFPVKVMAFDSDGSNMFDPDREDTWYGQPAVLNMSGKNYQLLYDLEKIEEARQNFIDKGINGCYFASSYVPEYPDLVDDIGVLFCHFDNYQEYDGEAFAMPGR